MAATSLICSDCNKPIDLPPEEVEHIAGNPWHHSCLAKVQAAVEDFFPSVREGYAPTVEELIKFHPEWIDMNAGLWMSILNGRYLFMQAFLGMGGTLPTDIDKDHLVESVIQKAISISAEREDYIAIVDQMRLSGWITEEAFGNAVSAIDESSLSQADKLALYRAIGVPN
jgi:hypothetical protein